MNEKNENHLFTRRPWIVAVQILARSSNGSRAVQPGSKLLAAEENTLAVALAQARGLIIISRTTSKWTTPSLTMHNTPHYVSYITNSGLRAIHHAYAPRVSLVHAIIFRGESGWSCKLTMHVRCEINSTLPAPSPCGKLGTLSNIMCFFFYFF